MSIQCILYIYIFHVFYAEFAHTEWCMGFLPIYERHIFILLKFVYMIRMTKWYFGSFVKPFHNSLIRLNGVMSAPHSSHDNNRHRFAIQFNSIESTQLWTISIKNCFQFNWKMSTSCHNHSRNAWMDTSL